MALHAVPMDSQAWSDAQLDELFADGFDPWMTADPEVKRYIDTVRVEFGDLELAIVEGDELVAAGWGVPLEWDGSTAHLPSGYTDALRRSVESSRGPANTFSVMAIQVHPAHRGHGVAAALIHALRELAQVRGWGAVIAPVRPTLKSMYPTIDIERYASWTRSDGLPLDPWLRTHVRSGARVSAVAPSSQRMVAPVEAWELWCGMVFPDSGNYVVPNGLSTLAVDRGTGAATMVEPNVWVEYPELGTPND